MVVRPCALSVGAWCSRAARTEKQGGWLWGRLAILQSTSSPGHSTEDACAGRTRGPYQQALLNQSSGEALTTVITQFGRRSRPCLSWPPRGLQSI